MSLVVLVPLITSVNAIEVSRFPGPILIFPIISCPGGEIFLCVEEFFFFIEFFLCFRPIESFRCKIGAACGLLLLRLSCRGGLNGFGYKSRSRHCTALLQLEKIEALNVQKSRNVPSLYGPLSHPEYPCLFRLQVNQRCQ